MQNMSGGKTALGLDINVGSMLCYLPICAISLIYSIIVIVADKDNRSVRYHAFQSLLITGVYIIAVIAISIFSTLIAAVTGSGLLASLFSLLTLVVVVVFLAVMIYGCVKAYQGSQFKLPIVGDMAEKWA